MSPEIQPHRRYCGPLIGWASSEHISRGWMEGGKQFVSSSFLLFWFVLFCFVSWTTRCCFLLIYLPKSLFPSRAYAKGKILLHVSSHTPQRRDCIIWGGHAMGSAGGRHQSNWSNSFAFSQGKQMTDLAVSDTFWALEILSPPREPQVNEMENAVSRFCSIRNHQT